MQTRKKEVEEKIIRVSKEEFILNGFSGTTMRTISKKSGISLSNIYNYYKSKDDIFKAIVLPGFNSINSLLSTHNLDENLDIKIFVSRDYIERNANSYVKIIEEHRESLFILFFKSTGSCYENFKEGFIQEHTRVGIEYMELMKRRYPEINTDISEFFIHTMSSVWINNICEIVMHDLSSSELRAFIKQYLDFSTAGWKKVMKV